MLKRSAFFSCLIYLSAGVIAMSHTSVSTQNADRISKIRHQFENVGAIYNDFALRNHIPGYAYGLIVDGKLVSSGSGGFINVAQQIRATPQSMFRIASMTKSFTAMAILKLRDEGKLRLDDPVALYIPEIKNQQFTHDTPAITIRDLLTHSAGYPTDDPWADRRLANTPEELISLLKRGVFFAHVPGVAFEYSNLGYTMLGYIINKVAGGYQEYIAKHIWQPLGMQDAAWEYSTVSSSQLARGYRWENEQWLEEPLLHDGIFGAMGGMIASVESFSRYMALHLSAWPPRNDVETGPVKRSSIREMQQPSRFSELVPNFNYPDGHSGAQVSAYGYGLRWIQDDQGRVYVGHSGGLPGFGSNWMIMPEYGIGVVILTNATYPPTHLANLAVLHALVSNARLEPRPREPSQVLQQMYQQLVKLLPTWERAESSGLFAQNFFLDTPVYRLKHETEPLFIKAGAIKRVGPLQPENQARGSFDLEGEHATLQAYFELSPEHQPLIQKFILKEIPR